MAAQAAANATAASHAASAHAVSAQNVGVGRGNSAGGYTLTEPLLIPGSSDNV